MSFGYTDLIGYAAGVMTTVAFLPQAIKVWRTRSARDLSLGMYLIFTGGVGLWLIYGLLLRAWPLVAANAVTFVLAGAILLYKLREGS